MKLFCFFTVVFLVVGISSVTAQDLIVLKDGNIIESKIVELSPTEIRYKRFDHLDGPTIVIPVNNVLSIRYENGKVENINAAPIAEQKNNQTESPRTTAMDPNKFTFGINANAGGALGNLMGGPSGFGINIELGKGKFNSEINLMFPTGGFGLLFTFNGFWPSRIGGFYLGGGIGFSIFETTSSEPYSEPYQVPYEYWDGSSYSTGYRTEYRTGYRTVDSIAFSLPLGLNIGYKFVTRSGVYFRTGAFVAIALSSWDPFYFKPDLSIGWTMR